MRGRRSAMTAAARRMASMAQRADRRMRTACRRCAKDRDAARSTSIDERSGRGTRLTAPFAFGGTPDDSTLPPAVRRARACRRRAADRLPDRRGDDCRGRACR
ncbi:hypothetical protein C6T56_21970 [Burkholderia multivorans]|nr:hypothetical protein C6V04_08630 [Burkholderia multivorans]PRH15953.1 hypothetical protein C6T56_21970 [Burkholderia multivorans]